MKTIWKFRLSTPPPKAQPASQALEVPKGAEFLYVGPHIHQRSWHVAVWARVDTNAPTETISAWVVRTGDEVPDRSHYLGSLQTDGSYRTWHVFVEAPDVAPVAQEGADV